MAWEPSVLRKYNTTGHFRLLNQLRSELKANPLVRPKDGESIGEVNRSKALIRAIEGRSQGYGRRSRSSAATAGQAVTLSAAEPAAPADGLDEPGFRERLNGVELR